jgi:WD40 repeat protein/HEAT repeat protein
MSTDNSTAAAAAPPPFPKGPATDCFLSLTQMRNAHGELLQAHREKKDAPEFTAEVERFLRRGQASGALLTDENDRFAAQSLLDYWAMLLYRVYGKSAEVTLEEPHPELEPELGDDQCPYLGPRSFQEDQSKFLFGRDKLITRCLQCLRDNRVVVLVGSPGSGRTSLVNAGILPALKEGALPGSKGWRYFSAGSTGLNLVEVVADTLSADRSANPLVRQLKDGLQRLGRRGRPADHFRQDPDLLAKVIDAGGDEPAVLVIDQFEQLFTLCTGRDRQVAAANLARLVRREGRKHYLILLVRADTARRVAELGLFPPELDKDQVHVYVPPLTTEELRRAILEPAEQVGLKFDPLVVDQLLLDVQGDPGVLALLQFNLLRLWDHRTRNKITWATYKRVGGGRQALQDAAEEFYRDLSPKERQAARRVLLTMVQPTLGPDQFILHRIPRAAPAAAGGSRALLGRLLDWVRGFFQRKVRLEGSAEERAVIEKLLKARLLYPVPGTGGGGEEVALVHEALVNYWPQLSGWLEEERDRLRTFWLRVTLALAIGSGLLAIGLAVVYYRSWQRADQNWQRAEVAEAEAQKQKDKAQEENVRWTVQCGGWHIQKGDGPGALLWFNRALQLASDNRRGHPDEISVHRMRVGGAVRQLPPLSHLLYHRELSRAEFSPDGRYVATAGQAPGKGGTVHAARLWDASTGNPVGGDLRHDDPVNHLAFSTRRAYPKLDPRNPGPAEGHYLVTASGDPKAGKNGQVTIWHVPTGRRVWTWEHKELPVTYAAFSPNGRWLLAVASHPDRTRADVRMWELPSGAPVALQDAPPPVDNRRWVWADGEVTCAAFSQDNRYLAVTANRLDKGGEVQGGETQLWSLSPRGEWKPMSRPFKHRGAVQCAAFSPDHRWLVTTGGPQDDGSSDPSPAGEVEYWRVWSVAREEPARPPLRPSPNHKDLVTAVAFSPDGRFFITTGQDNLALLWKLDSRPDSSGQYQATVSAHQTPLEHSWWVLGAAFSPDGRYVVTSSRDQKARVWEVDTAREALHALNHSRPVTCSCFSPDGRRVLTVSEHLARIWDTTANDPVEWTLGSSGAPAEHALSQDGRWLVEADRDRVGVHDLKTREWHKLPLKHGGRGTAFGFGPRGDRLVTVSRDRPGDGCAVRAWELEAGKKPRARLLTDSWSGSARQVAFSGDGRLVAVLASPGRAAAKKAPALRVWEMETGKEIPLARPDGQRTGPLQDLVLTHITVSFDGRFVAGVRKGVDSKGAALVWDLKKSQVHSLRGHKKPVLYAAFNPTGTLLLTASADATALVWDPESGTNLLDAPLQHKAPVRWGAFTPEGNWMVTAGEDRRARVWELALDPGQKKATATLLATVEYDLAITYAEFSPPDTRIPAARRLLLTVTAGGTVQVWDWKAQELVAQFKHPMPLRSVFFHPGGEHIGTLTRGGRGRPAQVRKWALAPLLQPPAQLKGYAEALAAHKINEWTRTFEPLDPERLDELKGALQALALPAPPDDYHLRAAAQCETRRQWFAAAWHLGRVIDAQRPPHSLALLVRRDEALERLKRENWQAWAGLADAQLDSKQWAAAVQHYERAIDLKKDDWQLWAELALAQSKAGRGDEVARKSYEKAVALMPGDWQSKAEATYTRVERGLPFAVVMPTLLRGLSDPAPDTRRQAAEAIGRYGDRAGDAAPALIAALKDGDEQVRAQALEALAQVSNDAKVLLPVMAEVLRGQDAHLYAAASQVLFRVGPGVIGDVVSLLRKDSTPAVRLACVRTLAKVGSPAAEALADLTRILEEKGSEPALRMAAARALGNLGPAAKGAEGALGRAEKDPNPDVRNSAQGALALIRAGDTPIALRIQGVLSEGDPSDRVRQGCHTVVHIYPMRAGQTYVIDLESKDFDAYLRLENAGGKHLICDDDSGGGTDSRLVFRAPDTGRYRLIVTSFLRGVAGAYTLSVQPKAADRASPG